MRTPKRRRQTLRLAVRVGAAAAIATATVVVLGGCQALGDFTAWIAGAPTSTQVKAEQAKLKKAEAELGRLDDQLTIARRHQEGASKSEADAETRKESIRTLYATMAQQLNSLEGAAADAMLTSLDGLNGQLRAAETQRAGAAAVVAGFEGQIAELRAAQGAANRELADAEANLLGFADSTQAAISGVMATVGLASEAAVALGVPGAALATEKVEGMIRGGLELLLAGTGASAAMIGRRRRKQRDEERERRVNLTRVIQANEEFNLIKDDKDAREGAKRWAGPAAVREMKLARGVDLMNGAEVPEAA